MTLYRMIYVREGRPRGTTFAHKDARAAAEFAEAWARTIHCTLLTVVALRPMQMELELTMTDGRNT